jgi:hypothetical protein
MTSLASIGDTSQHQRKVGAVFSGAAENGGGGGVGSAHKVEPCGKDSIHLSDEARGKE